MEDAPQFPTEFVFLYVTTKARRRQGFGDTRTAPIPVSLDFGRFPASWHDPCIKEKCPKTQFSFSERQYQP
jgi:hypothetical protein